MSFKGEEVQNLHRFDYINKPIKLYSYKQKKQTKLIHLETKERSVRHEPSVVSQFLPS